MKFLFLLLLLFLIFGCYTTHQPSKDFTAVLNTKKSENIQLENKVFQMDCSADYPYVWKHGINSDTISLPYLCYPIYFFENNIICYGYGAHNKEEDLISRIQKEPRYFYNDNGWGVFELRGDTIMAKIYNYFWGKGSIGNTNKRFECNYIGFLKSQGTILDWKMVPPYPMVDKKYSDNIPLLESLKLSRNMYFKEVPLFKFIDPNKAWINKFKRQ